MQRTATTVAKTVSKKQSFTIKFVGGKERVNLFVESQREYKVISFQFTRFFHIIVSVR